MEVLQDTYNETNIGRLSVPSDWEVTKLGDNASLKNGANFSTKDVGNGRLMVNVKDLYNFRPFVKIVNETRVGKIADSYILNDGDILFVRSSLVREGVGFSAMYRNNGEETVYSGFIIRARIESDKIFNPFIAYYLRSGLGRKKIVSLAGTVTITNIGQEALSMLPIPIPPLPEQQKIADILSTVDDQISTTDKIIEKSKELKKGLMQKLFSEGIGHTEFKDTKIGRIPMDWEVIQLGELCEVITKGTTPTTNGFPYLKTGINFVKVESINAFGRFIKEKFAFVGEDCYKSFKRSQLKEGDILISIAGALGRTAIVTENILPANTNQAVGILRLKDKSLNNFIRYFLDSYSLQKFIERINVASAQANLNLGHLNKFNIPFPAINEQQKIVAILSEADAKIEKEQEQKTKLEQLKKGLMQQLLTGRKRVKV